MKKYIALVIILVFPCLLIGAGDITIEQGAGGGTVTIQGSSGGSGTPGGSIGNVQYYGTGGVLAGDSGMNYDYVASSFGVKSINVGGSGTHHLIFDSTTGNAKLRMQNTGSPGWSTDWENSSAVVNLRQILSVGSQYDLQMTTGTTGAPLYSRYTTNISGVTQIKNSTGTTIVQFDPVGNSSFTIPVYISTLTISSSGNFSYPSRILSELMSLTPVAVGYSYYCSDCATAAVCVSTGTAIASFSNISGKTTVCQ